MKHTIQLSAAGRLDSCLIYQTSWFHYKYTHTYTHSSESALLTWSEKSCKSSQMKYSIQVFQWQYILRYITIEQRQIYSMFVWIKQQILIARNKYEIINFSRKSNIHRREKKFKENKPIWNMTNLNNWKERRKKNKNLKLIERSKIL